MKTRIITGLVMGIVMILVMLLRQVSTLFFDIFVAVVLICSAAEVSKIFNRSKRWTNMTLATIFPVCVYVVQTLCLLLNLALWINILITIALLCIFSIIAFLWTKFDTDSLKQEMLENSQNPDDVNDKKKYIVNKTMLTIFNLIYPTILLNSLIYLNHTAVFVGLDNDLLGLFLIVLMFITTICTDTFAYFVGSTLKGKKLCPLISPNKTLSGAIGGLLGAIIGSICVWLIFFNIPQTSFIFERAYLPFWMIIIYGVIASVVSQAGDIFASYVKRRARAKDYSTIFPGHGGFMDRFDGVSFNAVFTFLLALIIF